MPKISRTTLAENLAAELRAQIHAGTWSEKLPGYRVLGRLYEVSQPTCTAALTILAAEGVIARSGERRPWRILGARDSATDDPKQAWKVLWFGETHEEVMEPSTLAVLTALRGECRLHGGSVTVEIGKSLWATRAATVASRLRDRYGPDRVLLHNAPKRMILAMVKTGVPVFMLGGELPREVEVEGMGQSVKATCREIATKFLRLGRRRIIIPVPAGLEGWRKNAIRGLVDAGAVNEREAERWVPLIEDDFPGALRDNWRSLLLRLRPDAVAVLNAQLLLSLYSAAWQAGLRPGKDFIAATTDSPDLLRWLDPPPLMLHPPIKQMEKHVIRWLHRPDPSLGHKFLKMRWPKSAH